MMARSDNAMSKFLSFSNRLYLLPLLAVVLLGGCAMQPSQPTPDAAALDRLWASRHAELSGVDVWTMSGRVAVKNANDSWSASLQWQQQAEAFDIRFSSMLGQRIAQLTGDDLGAALHLPEREVVSAANLSELLDSELGWQLPIDGLRFWVVGLPTPQLEMNRELDAQGRLKWLEQAGWRIVYSRYLSSGSLEIPKKLVITRDDLRIRLVVDRWQAGASAAASQRVVTGSKG